MNAVMRIANPRIGELINFDGDPKEDRTPIVPTSRDVLTIGRNQQFW